MLFVVNPPKEEEKKVEEVKEKEKKVDEDVPKVSAGGRKGGLKYLNHPI